MLHRLLYVVAALSLSSGFLIPSSSSTDDRDHQCEGKPKPRMLVPYMTAPSNVQYETIPVRYQYQPEPVNQYRNQYNSYGGGASGQNSLMEISGAKDGGQPTSQVYYDSGSGRYGAQYGSQDGVTAFGGGYNMKQYDAFNGQQQQMQHQLNSGGVPYYKGSASNGMVYKNARSYGDHGMVPVAY